MGDKWGEFAYMYGSEHVVRVTHCLGYHCIFYMLGFTLKDTPSRCTLSIEHTVHDDLPPGRGQNFFHRKITMEPVVTKAIVSMSPSSA